MLKSNEIKTKAKYFVTVEIKEYYCGRKEQFELLVDIGDKPRVGDLIAMLKTNLGIDMELKDINPYMEFKPIIPIVRGLQEVRVVRYTSVGWI